MPELQPLSEDEVIRMQWLTKPVAELGGTVTPPTALSKCGPQRLCAPVELLQCTLASATKDKIEAASSGTSAQAASSMRNLPRWNVLHCNPACSTAQTNVNKSLLSLPVVVEQTANAQMLAAEKSSAGSQEPEASTGRARPELSEAIAVELCAGSCKLTAAMSKAGFQGIAVDQERNRHKQHAAVAKLDLARRESWTLLQQLFDEDPFFFTWGGPPCGTGSRAREIPIAPELISAGAPQPQQLRSDAWPQGLPSLRGTDLAKVQTANAIWNQMAQFMEWILNQPKESKGWIPL